VRDLRGLVRSRLAIRRYQTAFKNRIHGVLNQYGLKNQVEEEEDIEVRDWFSVKAHAQLMRAIESLPSASREALRQEYILVRELELKIKSLETAIKARTGKLGWMRLLQTLPGVGPILGATIWLEIGDVRLSHGATSGGVCRAGAARAVQRRQNVARAGFEVVQSVFEMGFCGSRQYGGEVPEEMGRKTSACSETLPASEGDDEDFGQGESGRWPTSGGGQLVGSEAETGLP
jgi:transposase